MRYNKVYASSLYDEIYLVEPLLLAN